MTAQNLGLSSVYYDYKYSVNTFFEFYFLTKSRNDDSHDIFY